VIFLKCDYNYINKIHSIIFYKQIIFVFVKLIETKIMKTIHTILEDISKFNVRKIAYSGNKKIAFLKLTISLILIFFCTKLLTSNYHKLEVVSLILLLTSSISIIYSSYISSNAIFKIIFNKQALDNNGNFQIEELQSPNSIPLMLFWSLIIGMNIITFSYINNCNNDYEEKQLHLYGKTVKVKINKISINPKSSPSAEFLFENKNKIINGSLSAREFKENDETYVTFSTENPNIIVWTDIRQKEIKKQLFDHQKTAYIKIKEVYFNPKLGNRAKFDLNYNGKTIECNLPAKNFKKGDSTTVVYSRFNLNIMGWTYKEAIYQ
jgi:hypothetical protein